MKMRKNEILALITIVVMASTICSAFEVNIQPAKASGTIYIRADGSIEPPTANITTVDKITYTLTGNVSDEIVVERSNIVVDGQGYTVQDSPDDGFDLRHISNVTIRNTNIMQCEYGIYFNSSNDCTVFGNNIIANKYPGIEVAGEGVPTGIYGLSIDGSTKLNQFGIDTKDKVLAVAAGSKHKDAAYQFVEWLLRD